MLTFVRMHAWMDERTERRTLYTPRHILYAGGMITCWETVQGIRSPEALFPLDKLLRIDDLEISPSKQT